MPSITLELRHGSPLSNRILSAVSIRINASKEAYQNRHHKWRENEKTALAYLPEDELSHRKKVERSYYGVPDYTKIRIPYSYGILMASHTYWTTVFMGRTPVNQYTGRHGESQQQVQAMEALIDYQAQVGEMMVPWYLWLLDVGKYGLGVVGIDWVDEYSMVSSIDEVPVMFAGVIDTGKTKKRKINRRIKGYSGNRITNIRPFDFYPDPRVAVRFFQKGEFCAVKISIGWNDVLKRLDQGYYIKQTVDMLRNKLGPQGTSGHQNYDRVEGADPVQLPTDIGFDLDDSGIRGKKKKNLRNANVQAFECVIELVPKDWGLGRGTYPEKWVFTVLSDFTAVLGAQPLGANHDKFPYAALEYEPEGYAISARGIGEVLQPINDTMDWLINSHFFNVRKALNDQYVVDPSQIVVSDLENPLPGGVIRMTPAAYGRSVRDALQQLPVTDVTRTHLGDLSAMFDVGQRTVGVSDQIMGNIPTTGRRSATEVRTGTGFGINRLKSTSEFFSYMGWSPMSSIMVQNTQQYYDIEKAFKIAGQLAQGAGAQFMQVTPEDILGFYDFVPVDGTQPIDRIAQATLWNNLMGQMANFPEILAQYDVGRIFEWVAQLAGLKNISQFKIEMVPDEELQNQEQLGNVVSLGGRGGGEPSNTQGSPPPPTQIAVGGPNNF